MKKGVMEIYSSQNYKMPQRLSSLLPDYGNQQPESGHELREKGDREIGEVVKWRDGEFDVRLARKACCHCEAEPKQSFLQHSVAFLYDA
jgi:hypothetical protein